MRYKLTTLTNGLRVIAVPMPSLESATVTVWVKVGSRFEEAKISGISHFLEHMAFKGSKKRPSTRDISETIEAIGGVFNATTAREWTNFFIKSRSKLIETSFDVLADMLLNPILRESDIERERGVILEEIALRDDTPTEKVGDLFTQLIFKGNSLGQDISGTKESVKRIQRKDFEQYRKVHYGGKNIVITVAGGIKVGVVEKLIKTYFGKLAKKKEEKAREFKLVQKSPRTYLEYKDSEQAHLVLGFPAYRRAHKQRFALSVLSTILGSGMSSRLFIEIRDKRGLAYVVGSSSQSYIDTGFFAVYAGVVTQRVDEAIKVILDQLHGISGRRYPVSKKELNKTKEFIKGRMALALENTRNVNEFFAQRILFLPKIETPEQVFAKIDKVTIDDVVRVAKDIINTKMTNLTVIGPYKNQARFERLLA